MGFAEACEATEKHCPNCGEFIGYIPAFQVYEELVAKWLRGEMCPPGHTGFDVWKCEPFPLLTFQVKHSEVYHFKGKGSTRHSSKTWNFNQGTWRDDTAADYFVLLATDDIGEVQTFLMSRDRFVKHSAKNATGGRILNTTSNRNVKRGSLSKGYYHTPYIWGYHVGDPETELIQAVLKREELLTFEREIQQSQAVLA